MLANYIDKPMELAVYEYGVRTDGQAQYNCYQELDRKGCVKCYRLFGQ